MSDEAIALAHQEYRLLRRLARLFRAERTGRFAGRPDETVQRLIERRGRLVDHLTRIDAKRRSLAPWDTIDLDLAVGALANEVRRSERHCLERLAELGAELERRRGVWATTGLRDGANGQLLGQV